MEFEEFLDRMIEALGIIDRCPKGRPRKIKAKP
jgi:hypothetical protein